MQKFLLVDNTFVYLYILNPSIDYCHENSYLELQWVVSQEV